MVRLTGQLYVLLRHCFARGTAGGENRIVSGNRIVSPNFHPRRCHLIYPLWNLTLTTPAPNLTTLGHDSTTLKPDPTALEPDPASHEDTHTKPNGFVIATVVCRQPVLLLEQ